MHLNNQLSRRFFSMKNIVKFGLLIIVASSILIFISGCGSTVNNSSTSWSTSVDTTADGTIGKADAERYRIVAATVNAMSMHAFDNDVVLSTQKNHIIVVTITCSKCNHTSTYNVGALEQEQIVVFHCDCDTDEQLPLTIRVNGI